MATRSEVEAFLSTFKTKLAVFGAMYLDRNKNLQALIDLEMTKASDRTAVLQELKVEDYFQGPTKDTDGGPHLWEFGRVLKKKEDYHWRYE